MTINKMIEEIKKVISKGVTYDQLLNGYIKPVYEGKGGSYHATTIDIPRMLDVLLVNKMTIKESLQEWKKPSYKKDEKDQKEAQELISKVVLRNSKKMNSEEKIFPSEEVIVNELALYCNQVGYDGIGYRLLANEGWGKSSQLNELLYKNNFMIAKMMNHKEIDSSRKIHIDFQEGKDLLEVKAECPVPLMDISKHVQYFPAIQSVVEFDINASSGKAKYENISISYKIPRNFEGVSVEDSKNYDFDESQFEYEEYSMLVYRNRLTAVLNRILQWVNKIFGSSRKSTTNITNDSKSVNSTSNNQEAHKGLFYNIKMFISQLFNRIFRRKTSTSNENSIGRNDNNSSLNSGSANLNDKVKQNYVNNSIKVAKEKIREGIVYKSLLSQYIQKENSNRSNFNDTWVDLDRGPVLFVNGKEIRRQSLSDEKEKLQNQTKDLQKEVQKIFSEVIFQGSKISPSEAIIKELAMHCNQGSYYGLGYGLLSEKGEIAKLIGLSNQNSNPLQFKDIASNRKIAFNVLSSNNLHVESKGYYELLCPESKKCFSKIYCDIKFDINSSLGKAKYENIVISYKISKNTIGSLTGKSVDENQLGEYEEYNMPVYRNKFTAILSRILQSINKFFTISKKFNSIVNGSNSVNNTLNEEDIVSDSGVDVNVGSHNAAENAIDDNQGLVSNNSIKNGLNDDEADDKDLFKSVNVQQINNVKRK